MPKIKRGERRTPPVERVVIKEVPLVVKPPQKPQAAPVSAADPEQPPYY